MHYCSHKLMALEKLHYMRILPIYASQWPFDTNMSSDFDDFPSDPDKTRPELSKLGTEAPQTLEGLLVAGLQVDHLVDVLPCRSPRTWY